MLRCHSCRCVSSKVSMVFASLKVLSAIEKLKSSSETWTLGSKKIQFIHKISTTISQHNWHEINENFTKFQGQRRKKKHENMQYEYHIFPTHSFTKAPNSLAFCQASRRTQKVGPLGPQLWMWEMYRACLEMKWRLTKVDELFLRSLDDGCINVLYVLFYCEALWIPNIPFGGQICSLELQMTRLTSCCSWSSCNSATTDSFLSEKYVRVKENTENPACLGPSIFFGGNCVSCIISAVPLRVPNTSTTPGAACVSPNFKAIRGTSYLLQAPMIEGCIGCPHSNSKVSSTWDKLAVASLEFCQGSALAVFPNLYRHKANLIMQYLGFGSSPTRGDVLFSKQSRGVIGNHCAIWWYQRPISRFHRRLSSSTVTCFTDHGLACGGVLHCCWPCMLHPWSCPQCIMQYLWTISHRATHAKAAITIDVAQWTVK